MINLNRLMRSSTKQFRRDADTFTVTRRVLQNHWSLPAHYDADENRTVSMVNPIKVPEPCPSSCVGGPAPLRNEAEWAEFDAMILREQAAFIDSIEAQIAARAPKSLVAIIECARRFPVAAKLFPSIPGLSYSAHDLSAYIVRLFSSARTTDHLDTTLSFARQLSRRAAERHPNAGRWNSDQLEMFDSFVYRSYHLFHRKLRSDDGPEEQSFSSEPRSSTAQAQVASEAGTFSSFLAVALGFFKLKPSVKED